MRTHARAPPAHETPRQPAAHAAESAKNAFAQDMPYAECSKNEKVDKMPDDARSARRPNGLQEEHTPRRKQSRCDDREIRSIPVIAI